MNVTEQANESLMRRTGEEEPGEEVGPIPVEEISDEDRALLENLVTKRAWNLLAGHYPDRRLTPDTSPQLDLGIDSLEWVNLWPEIGRSAGVELDEEAIDRVDTVRDLLREVTGQAETVGASRVVSPLEQTEEVLSDEQKRFLEPLGPAMWVIARGIFALNRVIARAALRLRVEGAEHQPEEKPFVIAPNHASYLDAFAVAAALVYRRMRRTYWAAFVGAAFDNPVNSFVSRLAKAVPLEADRVAVSSLAFGTAVLKRSNDLVCFPGGRPLPPASCSSSSPVSVRRWTTFGCR